MRIILFAILIWFASVIQGQTYFEKTFDIDSAGDLSSSVILTSSGFFVSGEGIVDGDWFIENRAIDSIGNQINSVRIGDVNHLYGDGGYDGVISVQNSIYFGGGYENYNDNKKVIQFVKANLVGDTIFTKSYDIGNDREAILSIIFLNNFFYGCGYIQEKDTNGNYFSSKNLLTCFDLNGNLIWHKLNSNSNGWKKIESLSDGNLVVAGRIRTDAGLNEFDIVVTKVDTAGNEIWTYSPVKLEYQSLEGLVVTSNDEIVAYGYDENSFLLLKLDSDGSLVWEKKYGINTGQNSNSFFNLEVLPDGSFIGCGEGTKFSQSSTVLGTVLKICSEGELEWIRYYGSEDFPSHFYDIEPTNDGGYIAVGSTLGDSGTQDIWVMKMDSLGCDTPGCAVNEVPFICPEDTLSINDKLVNNSIKLSIYPNPFEETLTVKFNVIASATKQSIKLYDLLGKEITSFRYHFTRNDEIVLDASKLQKGVYYIKIMSKDYIYTERILKE